MVWQGGGGGISIALVYRAQRLAASVVWQVHLSRGEVAAEECLNALRHQWFGRPKCHNGCSAKSVVLNALRHQWFGRCSMIGYSTIEQIRAQRLAASVVWQGPPSPGILMPPCWKCSTPCGISGLAGGYGKGGDVSSGNACSTPCGISGLAGRAVLAGGVPGDRAQRLAASVVLAGACRSDSPCNFSCAQRLAASVVWQDCH